MQNILLWIPILFLSFSSTAQINTALEGKLDSISVSTEKVDLIVEWANNNYKKYPDQAFEYLQKSLHLSTKIKYHKGIGLSLMRMGVIEKNKENFTNANKLYSEAIKNFNFINDSLGTCKAILNRGNVYLKEDQFNLAINDFFICLKYFEKINDQKLLFAIYNNIGLVYKNLKDYEKSYYYYSKSLNIALKSNSSLYYCYNNLANIFSLQNNYGEALSYYKKNLEILNEEPNKYQLAQTYHNIGSCFFEMRQYSMALEYLNQSLLLKKEIGNKNLTISTLNSLAHVFYAQNNYKDALEYRKKALALAIETKNIEYQKNCNEELFKIFTHLNMADSALHYFSDYELLKDSIFNLKNLKQIAEIQEKYESEKKETQITLLEKVNKSRMWQRNSLIVLLILLIGYAIFIVRSYYINKKTHRLLQLQNERIQWHKTLLDQKNVALSDSNKTKNRLFQIISHDLRSPLASVYNIAQLIKIFIQQRKYQLLEESCHDMEESISNVLSLTDNLLSWSLNQSGKLPYKPAILSLKPLLENNLRTYSSVAKQKNIHLQLLLEETVMVFADRQMLDTVIRNLINNSLKFTKSGGVIAIGLNQSDNFVELWIKDSGIGISEDQIAHLFEIDHSQSYNGTNGEKGNGLGLLLCKQFIEQNKGEIRVESTLNLGTTFRITIPAAENTNEISTILSSNANAN
ncbi:tetratricopeptide repeat-containing sensor histidine kinase [Labilibaculum manganireducens]|uniref:tetratricopeptide repeat-containing sensor histidine kinase n=1 Tax=Labilibaculum manganireducens TaxID=1940525 RepID=UPI0029F5C8E1|nr:tetratricopeptide repeat-containing sensor histidine kinase [Labilibaculum manganireducens]